LEQLISNKFIDPEDQQNNSPRVKDIYNFMKNNPQVYAYGYAVSPKRKDYRVSIEGLVVNKKDVSEDLKQAFFDFCKTADEIHIDDGLVSWWD
jgi:hypothetical protein